MNIFNKLKITNMKIMLNLLTNKVINSKEKEINEFNNEFCILHPKKIIYSDIKYNTIFS